MDGIDFTLTPGAYMAQIPLLQDSYSAPATGATTYSPAVEFRVLGPVEVHDQGVPLDIGGPKAGALIAALLAHRGETLSQDRLSEAIWPDSPRSRDTLQSYVSRVRKKLGDEGRDLLLRNRAGYVLDVAGQLDAERFESLLADGSAALTGQDSAVSVELINEGLGLWRGAAFGEFAGDELVHAKAARLEELRLTAREQRIDAELGLGRHREVITELEALCDEHPLRERLWELRMLALVRGGRQAEALRAYQRAREILIDELGIEPSERLRRMEHMVLTQDPGLDVSADPNVRNGPPVPNRSTGTVFLPAGITSFIGRDDEVSKVKRLLDETRLLTLTGIGGVGKTRLAIQVAREWADDNRGAVGMVDLSGVIDPSEIASKLEECLASFGGEAGADVLIIVDNCEHLIEQCAEIVAELVTSRPDVRVVATSQEPLRLPGEIRWRVEPMAVPDATASADELAANDATRLFIDRSLATRPGMEFDDTGLSDIGRICRSLDGLPLAIELAAALVGTMGLRQIEQGLASRFELLREGYRTSPVRQQTLASAFDWSYELLADDDKRLFRELRPLPPQFPRRAAEVICTDDPAEKASIGAGLGRLVDRSLVQMEEQAGNATYGILPTMKQFLWDRAGWQGDFENRGFVVHLAQHTESRLRGTDEEVWSALFDGPTNEARAALDFAYHQHDLEAGSFLAGITAARMTSSARIAFVGGVRSRYIGRFELGFRVGAGHVRDDVTIDSVYLSEPPDFSGFMDIDRARVSCSDAYRRGTDVVFHAAGHWGGLGVLEATRQWHETTGDKRWVIGVDLDEVITRDPEFRPYIVTSMRRQIPTSVYLQIKAAVAAGEPERAPVFDLSNEGVGMWTTGGEIDHLMPELEAVRAEIVAGEVEVSRVTAGDGSRWSDPSTES